MTEATLDLYRSMKLLIAQVISNVLMFLYLTSIETICLPSCKARSTSALSFVLQRCAYGEVIPLCKFRDLKTNRILITAHQLNNRSQIRLYHQSTNSRFL